MLGKIKLPDGSEAELDNGGTWSHEDEVLAQMLNLRHNPAKESGAGSVLPFGAYSIYAAAVALNGSVLHAPKVPALKPGELS